MCLGGDVTGSGSLGTSPQLQSSLAAWKSTGAQSGVPEPQGALHQQVGSQRGGEAQHTAPATPLGSQAADALPPPPPTPPQPDAESYQVNRRLPRRAPVTKQGWGVRDTSGTTTPPRTSVRPQHRPAPPPFPLSPPKRLRSGKPGPGRRGLRRRLLKLWNPKTPRATAALAASGCGRGAGRDPPPPPPPPLPPPPAPRLRRARAPQAPPAPTRHTPTRFSDRPALPAAPRRPPLSVRTRGAPAACSRPPPSGSLRGRPGPACARLGLGLGRPPPSLRRPISSAGGRRAAGAQASSLGPRLREALVPPRVTEEDCKPITGHDLMMEPASGSALGLKPA
ncbi:formin-like protein 5 [Vulpes lagopus]|uniref:formin-like protein 5 n=1 Tax=Vulpes lagopus TaxID=494514 RepID=UPI001BC8D755|nr:formin-like protein 5 [Vulpes lagopus]